MSATIKAFLSYSTKDKDLATDIKDFFDELGINTFLAHQTIEASAEWRREIRKQLEKRQVFLALLTSNSHESDWVDQEIGMAIAFKKMIVPILAQTPLYGFVADFQAVETRRSMDSGQDLESHQSNCATVSQRSQPYKSQNFRGASTQQELSQGSGHGQNLEQRFSAAHATGKEADRKSERQKRPNWRIH